MDSDGHFGLGGVNRTLGTARGSPRIFRGEIRGQVAIATVRRRRKGTSQTAARDPPLPCIRYYQIPESILSAVFLTGTVCLWTRGLFVELFVERGQPTPGSRPPPRTRSPPADARRRRCAPLRPQQQQKPWQSLTAPHSRPCATQRWPRPKLSLSWQPPVPLRSARMLPSSPKTVARRGANEKRIPIVPHTRVAVYVIRRDVGCSMAWRRWSRARSRCISRPRRRRPRPHTNCS